VPDGKRQVLTPAFDKRVAFKPYFFGAWSLFDLRGIYHSIDFNSTRLNELHVVEIAVTHDQYLQLVPIR